MTYDEAIRLAQAAVTRDMLAQQPRVPSPEEMLTAWRATYPEYPAKLSADGKGIILTFVAPAYPEVLPL